MTLAGFLLVNLLRNRRRTALTALSLAASVFLVATLEGLLRHVEDIPRAIGGEQRLFVVSRASMRERFPRAHFDKVLQVPGVEAATPMVWLQGLYREYLPENFFAQFGCDPDQLLRVQPELEPVDPETRRPRPELYEAFRADRAGAFVGSGLLDRFGWRLGDRVTLVSQAYPATLDFTIRAAFHARQGGDNHAFFFHWQYLDDALGSGGWVNAINVRTTSITENAAVIERIDRLFANSSFETHTQTETALRANFLQSLGNLDLIVRSIAAAVGFGMIMVAANTVAMEARERTAEIAVLRALGFTPGLVVRLFLAEAAVLALGASLAGAGAAALLGPFVRGVGGAGIGARLLADYELPGAVAGGALLFGTLTGVAAAALPAWRSSRLSIVATLRSVG